MEGGRGSNNAGRGKVSTRGEAKTKWKKQRNAGLRFLFAVPRGIGSNYPISEKTTGEKKSGRPAGKTKEDKADMERVWATGGGRG